MTMAGPFGTCCVILALVASSAVWAQDTVRVQANGAPKWGANVRLVQEVAIGQLDGPPEYAFGQVASAVMEPGGGFYLYDRNDRQIRRYDRAGRFGNVIGKRGGGPGEYEQMQAMAVTRDGRLIVHDNGNARITYFNPDGSVARLFRLSRQPFTVDEFIVDTSDRIYLTVLVSGEPGDRDESRGEQYLRLTPDGAVLDSFPLPALVFEQTGPGRGFFVNTAEGSRSSFMQVPLRVAYPPGGWVSGSSHANRFAIGQPGRPVLVVERRWAPVALGAEERAEWQASAEWLERNRPTGRPAEIPRTKPATRGLLADHLGRVWVHVFGPAQKRSVAATAANGRPQVSWLDRNSYDVFSPVGEYLGRVTLPWETVLLAIRDNRLLTRGKGPDGEDRVIVYRIDGVR